MSAPPTPPPAPRAITDALAAYARPHLIGVRHHSPALSDALVEARAPGSEPGALRRAPMPSNGRSPFGLNLFGAGWHLGIEWAALNFTAPTLHRSSLRARPAG